MDKQLYFPLGQDNSVRDESMFTGNAYSKSVPQTAEEVCKIIKHYSVLGERITVCGALTGLNGAGVPSSGHMLSTAGLNSVSYDPETELIIAGSGASFSDIELAVLKGSQCKREFPASPTEKSATIGGALSFCSAGLFSFQYGPVSDFVEEIEYCGADGKLYCVGPSDEAFSALLGSEGMLGVITSVKLRTEPRPAHVLSVMFFFPDDVGAMAFADVAAQKPCIRCLEYMDRASFLITQEFKNNISGISDVPMIPNGQNAGILLEICSDSDEQIENCAEELIDVAVECGGDPDIAWSFTDDEAQKLRTLRHCVSECINMKIARLHSDNFVIKKLNTDICWRGKSRLEILEYYRSSLAKTHLDHVIFGHIGNFSPYVNIIPQNSEEYSRAKQLIESWHCEASKQGAIVCRELGVGKLKKKIYCKAAPIDDINYKIKSKLKYDPRGMFNPDNMFTSSLL